MSRHEFRSAFDKISIRYKSKSDFNQAVDKFQGLFYCSYVDRRSNLTYYFRNHDLVDAALDELLSKPAQWLEKKSTSSTANPHRDAEFTVKPESGFTRNSGSSLKVNPKNPPPLYRDYNTETTTSTDNSGAIDSGGCGENLIFPKCTENERIAIQ